jgi:WD40 repeat protein
VAAYEGVAAGVAMRFKCSPLEGHVQLVTAVAFSSEGTNICSASADGTCRVWRIDDATCYFVLEGDKRVASCNFSADGKMIITGDWGYTTRVWDAVFGQPVMSLAGHQGKLTASRFRPDGNFMITASEDKHVRTWDPRRGVSVAYQAPDEMLDCAFHPDTVSIIGACKNGMLLVWDIRKPDETRLEIEAHGTDWVTCCALSASGDKALTSRYCPARIMNLSH